MNAKKKKKHFKFGSGKSAGRKIIFHHRRASSIKCDTYQMAVWLLMEGRKEGGHKGGVKERLLQQAGRSGLAVSEWLSFMCYSWSPRRRGVAGTNFSAMMFAAAAASDDPIARGRLFIFMKQPLLSEKDLKDPDASLVNVPCCNKISLMMDINALVYHMKNAYLQRLDKGK